MFFYYLRFIFDCKDTKKSEEWRVKSEEFYKKVAREWKTLSGKQRIKVYLYDKLNTETQRHGVYYMSIYVELLEREST